MTKQELAIAQQTANAELEKAKEAHEVAKKALSTASSAYKKSGKAVQTALMKAFELMNTKPSN